MITQEMEGLKFICVNCYGGSFKFMAKCYEKVIQKRKENRDTKEIKILERDLQIIQDMDILTEKKV